MIAASAPVLIRLRWRCFRVWPWAPKTHSFIIIPSQFLRRNFEQLQNKLGRWTIPVIVAARLTPGLMQVSSVVAGTVHIRNYKVVLAIMLSSIVYDGTLIILGTLARLGLKDMRHEYFAWIVIGFVAIMAAIFVAVHLIRRRSRWT